MMYTGFPSAQVELLRCFCGKGALAPFHKEAQGCITEGTLVCASCGGQYPISGGILRLLDENALNVESAHEKNLRDTHADEEYALSVEQPDSQAMEMGPTIAALRMTPNCVLLELGCGTGRYTMALAGRCVNLLAIDFSLASLQILAKRLPANSSVGLVHADITRFVVAPHRFHRCLSTLVSNLPSSEHRRAMYRLTALALMADGRFVFGTHHQDLRSRLHKIPQSGRYSEGGIYRYRFTRTEIMREVRPFFDVVRARPIQIELPFTRRLGLPMAFLSRIAERIPFLNLLGRLVLVEAERPVQPKDT